MKCCLVNRAYNLFQTVKLLLGLLDRNYMIEIVKSKLIFSAVVKLTLKHALNQTKQNSEDVMLIGLVD